MKYNNQNHKRIKNSFITTIHHIALFSMLHSTFIAPTQGIIDAYIDKYDKHIVESYNNAIAENLTLKENLPEQLQNQANRYENPEVYKNNKKETKVNKSIIYKADISEGIIGVSKDMPTDIASDNLFKVVLNSLPSPADKVYLKYDLYGVDGHHSVARSINDRFSIGGHLVKISQSWTQQKEEIDYSWLKEGENKILFTIPKGADYQYKIKNIRIEVAQQTTINQLLYINIQNTVLSKDNKIYIKGFIRGNNTNVRVKAEGVTLLVNNNEFEGFIPLNENIREKKSLIITAVDVNGIVDQEILSINNIMEADKIFEIGNKEKETYKFFEAYRKDELKTQGATIIVNDSSLIQDYKISITQLRNIDMPPLESGMINVTKGGRGYRFLPDGIKFSKPVNIALDYDTTLIPHGYSPQDIKTYFFDTKSKRWVAVKKDSLDIKRNILTSVTTHFTDYINGIIQVPESPESSAFMPTAMNDIKAADPSAEITLISPPEPSQKGDANISYPIKIPSGRNGMQPQLAVQYSNEAGNGWLGQGWNLSIPALSIDTRWGIPVFNPSKETELYSLAGEQLMYPDSYLPHRHKGDQEGTYSTEQQLRSSFFTDGKKQFTLRKQGSFTKIERLGNSPENYYWKVTNTEGVISWYGGKSAVTENAVIRNDQGNIVHWGLLMVEDVYGNNIKYEYDNATIPDQPVPNVNLNGGKIFYPKNIYYTGFNDQNGNYNVEFVRSTVIKQDATISARLGLKQIEGYLLDRIVVKHQTAVIRNYKFNYTNGKFDKTLLSSVAELDASNNEFYKHDFEYHDDIALNAGHLFKNPVNINLPDIDPNYSLGFGDIINPSAINTTQSTETGYNIRPSAGMQIRLISHNSKKDGTLTVGAPFGENKVKSSGKITLADIDGDGIDDIIYRTKGGLKYVPSKLIKNTSAQNSFLINQFSNESKSIKNINDFSKSTSSSKIVLGDSWDMHLSNFYAGTQRIKSKSESNIYFTDGNNDGLLDIVKDGVVYFNRIDLVTGEPTFNTSSEQTPNMLLTAENPVEEPHELPEEIDEDQQSEQNIPPFNDKYDVVKVWQAYADGEISIYNSIGSDQQVKITIEKRSSSNNDICILYQQELSGWYDNINISSLSYMCDPLEGNIWINKGDRIYFRIHQNETLQNPELRWKSTVYYTDIQLFYEEDEEEETWYDFPAYIESTDVYSFITSDVHPISTNGKGVVNIEWPVLTVKDPIDEIKYRIIKSTINAHGIEENIVIYPNISTNSTCMPYTTTTISASANLMNINVDENTTFLFEVYSETNVIPKFFSLEENLWRPKLTYFPDNEALQKGASSLVAYPVPKYSIYRPADYRGPFRLLPAGTDTNAPYWMTALGSADYGVRPNMEIVDHSYLTGNDNGSFMFVVKKNGVVIGKREVLITNGIIGLNDYTPIEFCNNCNVDNQNTKPVRFEYYVTGDDNVRLFEKYQKAVNQQTAIVGYNWNSSNPNLFNKTKAVSAFYDNMKHLGHMLNGWGQFLYNDYYDPDPNTPQGPYGKVINDAIIENPTLFLNQIDSSIVNTTCDETLPPDQYQECVENSMFDSLNLPDENASLDNTDITALIENIKNSTSGIKFNTAFIPMKPQRFNNDMKDDKWLGIYNNQFVSFYSSRAGGINDLDTASSGGGGGLSLPELNDDDEEGDSLPANIYTGMKAINKIHKSSSRAYSAGWGNFVVNKSESSYSDAVTDFIDLNGDGYPDIITADNIQITNMTGGHEQSLGDPEYGAVGKDKSSNVGLSASGRHLLSGRNAEAKKGQNHSGRHDSGSPSARIGVSVNLAGDNESKAYWLDLNGDGLPDRIQEEGNNNYKYQLNKGQIISNNIYEPFTSLSTYRSKPSPVNFNLGIGLDNIFANNNIKLPLGADISLSAGFSGRDGNTTTSFIDINGDGLVDMLISDNNNGYVRYNNGNGFNPQIQLSMPGNIFHPILTGDSSSRSISASGEIGLFFGFSICCWLAPVIHVKAGITFGAETNLSLSQTNKIFKDFNGDGYVDYLVYDNSGYLSASYSAIGRTNMLKSVSNPLGGKFTIDYEANAKTYDNPNAKWVMNKVVIEDGFDVTNDGFDTYTKRYVYENAKYDRREREFYGFETVSTIDYRVDTNGDPSGIYRTSTATYLNNNYFLNELFTSIYTYDNYNSYPLTGYAYNYSLKSLDENGYINNNGYLFPPFDRGGSGGRKSAVAILYSEEKYIYDENDYISATINYQHDKYGNITWVSDFGVRTHAYTGISYHDTPSLLEKNILRKPSEIEVYETRKRTTEVDPDTGHVEKIITAINDQENAETLMEYDQYGNLTKITYPPNADNQSMYYEYTYDTVEHKYITKVESAYGYISTSQYNYNFDKIIETTDITGNKMQYEYDSFGRVTKIKGPKEIAAQKDFTLSFQYYPTFSSLPSNQNCVTAQNFMPLAITQHYDSEHENNTLDTYTFIDGLARVVQVKKDIAINNGTPQSPNYVEMMSVSGIATYDEFGRVTKQYHPGVEQKSCTYNYVLNQEDNIYYSETIYDEIDRPIQIIDPDGNNSFITYRIDTIDLDLGEGIYGYQCLVTRTEVEQNNNATIITETYKDIMGRILGTNNVGPDGDIITTFNYNSATGELLMYKDAEGLTTTYQYDMVGRKTHINNPDSGETQYIYDLAGNLIKLQTANLAANTSLQPEDRFIKYNYDYNRLQEIIYPPMPHGDNISNVYYQYGDTGNNTGRLIHQVDATGEQVFGYGNMGEVIYNERTIVAPNIPTRIYSTSFEYDSWNRIKQIDYPDAEIVSYKYDLGGNLFSVNTKIDAQDYQYIKRIDYDHYEQRTYMLYGNNTENFYDYTPSLRRLNNLVSKTSAGDYMMNNFYEYDKVGNITTTHNNTPNTTNDIGGEQYSFYTYDNLNRLSIVESSFQGKPQSNQFGVATEASSYLEMQYNNTHGIVSKWQYNSTNEQYLNTGYTNTYTYHEGTHRVAEIEDNDTQETTYYEYDLNGNLLTKPHNNVGFFADLFWDESNRLRVHMVPQTTSHYIYDASGERVLKAFSGIQILYENGTEVPKPGYEIEPYITYPSPFITVSRYGEYTKHYYAGTQRIVSRIGDDTAEIFEPTQTQQRALAPETENKFDETKTKQRQIDDLNFILNKAKKGTASFKEYKPAIEDEEDETENRTTLSSATPQYTGIYYYHPDHLGSSTFLTDAGGMPYQFFLNLPFGEVMVEQHSRTEYYETPYKFNGKELDNETGMYYYGARYYDPKMSVWLSVDPLAEQFPGWNPYNYTMQNPINLIDPTGMAAIQYDDPPETGVFENGYVHTDNDGSWTYNNGIWYDNSGQQNNFLEAILIEGVSSNASVNVLTETDGLGHTYIQVGSYVFSNGRYNGSDSPSMGPFGITGDNILIKYSGQEATNFIKSRNSDFPTIKQKIDNINASKVFKNLNDRYNNGSFNKSSSGVIDGRYNLFSRNCTTCTIDALNAGGANFNSSTPSGLPFQINLHNSGKNPNTFFKNAQFEAMKGPKF